MNPEAVASPAAAQLSEDFITASQQDFLQIIHHDGSQSEQSINLLSRGKKKIELSIKSLKRRTFPTNYMCADRKAVQSE